MFAFPLTVLYLDDKCIFLIGFLMAQMFTGVEFLSARATGGAVGVVRSCVASEGCGGWAHWWMDTRVDGDIVGWRWQSLSCVLLCFIWAWGRSLPYCSVAPDASWWCFIYQNWKSGLRLDRFSKNFIEV